MSKFLPLFPLELVVFPGEKLKLHIFEPRYKQLIGECRDEGITFGLPAFLNGKIAEFGTEMRLINIFTTYDDGRMDILTEGLRAFRLVDFVRRVPEKLYAGGQVTLLENDSSSYSITVEELAQQYTRFHNLLKTGCGINNFDLKNLSYHLAQEVGLSLEQKVRLLSIEKESDRQLMLIDHLHSIIPVLEGVQETRRRVKGNGHFKKLPPLNF